MINETIVTGRKFRKLIDTETKNWVRTDPAIIAEKYRYKIMAIDFNIPFKPVDKSKIRYRGKLSMNDTFVFTEKYNNFDGRIITNESILYNEGLLENVRVEWDCGATQSSISNELVQRLGLKSCGIEMTTSTTNSELSNVYEISLILHDEIELPMKVNAAPNIHQSGIDMLIGMNVISIGDFAISTYNGTTCFSFRYPSQGLIDFTQQS